MPIKQELEDRQALEKANFELKMKVIYLEDALKKYSVDDLQSSNNDMEEISRLETLVDEKNNEIEQKNVLILKANTAIEALKAEILRIRSEESEHVAYQNDLEERVKQLTDSESQIVADLNQKIFRLQNQMEEYKRNIKSESEEALIEKKQVKKIHYIVNFIYIY